LVPLPLPVPPPLPVALAPPPMLPMPPMPPPSLPLLQALPEAAPLSDEPLHLAFALAHPAASELEVGLECVGGLTTLGGLSFSQLEALQAFHEQQLVRCQAAQLALARAQARAQALEEAARALGGGPA